MKRHYVHSSLLLSVGYDMAKEILELKFRNNGGLWQYFSFSNSAYKKFCSSDSLGEYFNTKIKGKYPELKLA